MGDDLGQQPAEPGRHAARQHAVPGVLRGRDAGRGQVAGAAARVASPARATITGWARTKRRRRSSRSSSATVLTDIFEQIEKGKVDRRQEGRRCSTPASRSCRKLPRDAGDRNRTSPFAFTGNKFEFRAVSSGQSIAMPNICLNVAVTDALDSHRDRARERPSRSGKKARGGRLGAAADDRQGSTSGSSSTATTTRTSGRRRPRKRGLLNLRNTVDALPELVKPDVGQGVREAQGAERARAARALRDRLRAATTRRSTSKASSWC